MANSPLLDGPSGARPQKFITWQRFVVYGCLIGCALFFLFPLYIMIITSLKNIDEIRAGNIFVPTMHPTLDAWFKAWDSACTGLYCEGIKVGFWNSIKITVPSTIVSILVASLTGYSLANWPFKFSEGFFSVLLLSSFIPYIVMVYPLVIITRYMGIFSTLPAVVLVHTIFGLPLLTLLFRNYFASLPGELFKAARVDGAGYWQIFFLVFAPMSMPIFTVAVILQVTGIWNDFLFGVIYAGPTNYPMTVQLNNIVNSATGGKAYNVDMAATILTGLVPLAIYFISGKYFVRGIAAGAVKG
ncbi:ABC transporter permease subunit [bacterium]|nr:ABC transporter permease subunit [bacterium]